MNFLKWHIQIKPRSQPKEDSGVSEGLLRCNQKREIACTTVQRSSENEPPESERGKLSQYWERSKEYRVMLQEYQLTLKQRELLLDEREAQIEEKEQNIKSIVMKSVYEEREKVHDELDRIQNYISALRETEIVILDWVRRMEKREQSMFGEIMEDAKKFQNIGAKIDGFDFENYIANLMKANNFQSVVVTPKSGDYGADITAEKENVKYVVQCKHYSSQVGIDAVQQIYSAKEYYNAHVAVVATNSVFTKAAKTLAGQLNVLLWDCVVISSMEKAKVK